MSVDVDWRVDAPVALRGVLDDLTGPATGLLDEAVTHLADVLRSRPIGEVAAVAVPAAVFAASCDAPVPAGLLAAAGATYLAFDVLDDVMDGDRPACWRDRRLGEVVVGTQILLVTAAQVIDAGLPAPVATRVRAAHRAMLVEVADGQLRAESPLAVTTTAADVAARVEATSGAMLGGFAEIAAIAAGADDGSIVAVCRFGRELAIARQHVNDLAEVFSERTSDLRNRTATMVAVFALQRRPPEARQQLLDDLHAAAADPLQLQRLRGELGPAVAEVSMLAGMHLAAARSASEFVGATRMGQHGLADLIEHTAATLRSFHGH